MRKILSLVLGLLWALPSWGALPTGYTQLEYINMPAGAYLLTDIIPVYNGHYEIDFQTTEIQNSSAIFSGRTATYGGMLFTVASSGKFVVDAFGADSIDRYSSTVLPAANTRYKFIFNNKVATLESGDSRLFEHTFTGTGANGAVLVIKGTNSNGSIVGNNANYYIYSFQAWNPQGTLIANFIPAKDSSGVVGMYDTVGNRFYTNAGTGEFVAGPDACNGTIVNYTSATGTVSQSGTPTPDNPIEPVFYQQGNMVLRKVGDYADSYDATTGKITRRVGVKVLDGTENWVVSSSYLSGMYNLVIDGLYAVGQNDNVSSPYSSHFGHTTSWISAGARTKKVMSYKAGNTSVIGLGYDAASADNLEGFKSWLAAQKAAGTPVTVYYPLTTETTENWTESQYCNANEPIKIATTKYNETAFSPLNTALQQAISVVDTVVSNTITQAGRIATLQAQKQTRPNDIADDNEKCPAGKKCLLVEDASGTPHWYEIVENAYGLPSGYTALEYIQSDGASYLIVPYRVNNKTVFYCRYNEIQDGPQTANAVFGVTTLPDVSKANNGILRLTGSNFNRMGWGDSVSGSVIDVTAPKAFNTWYEVLYEQNKLYQNDRLYATSATQTNVSWVAENDLGIFARNSESVTMPAVAKISSVWAKENGEYKINLIPARRNSDNVIGMYDTVSGEFFTNQGTGEFIAGDPVSE